MDTNAHGYEGLMRQNQLGGQPWGLHAAAGLQGMSQGVMSPRMQARFNAGAGGYQDLYKRAAYTSALKEMQDKSAVNEMKRKYGDILADSELESLERGSQPTPKGGSFSGGLAKGASVGASMFGLTPGGMSK